MADWRRRFPADVHPSGADIIRTWAYYLMVRHLALFSQKPYKSCLINGMVLGDDGRKMSKSIGNYIATPDVFNKYGADATRQWAAGGGSTGSDIPFRWPDAEFGWRFLIKLWNAARFCSLQLTDYEPQQEMKLEILDKWLLSKLEVVTENVTNALQNCNFNVALEEARNFTWHNFCDSYIEAVKHRLYRPETYGTEKKTAAQYTLYNAIYRILQLLAPVSPHLTEEIYQTMYFTDKKHKSINVSPWPAPQKEKINKETEEQGDLIISVMEEIRRDKAEKGMPLNTQITKLVLYAANEKNAQILNLASEDIKGTCKTLETEILPSIGEGKPVQGYPDIRVAVQY
jgi:valyl-tRNA synthetase